MMSNDDRERFGNAAEPRPHVFDPLLNPEPFEGVLARRVIAFVIDVVVIVTPVVLAAIFILLFGIVTLGVGWLLYWLLSPATIIWAVVYYGLTLGGPRSATIGMRMVDIEMRTWYGAPLLFRPRGRPCRPVLGQRLGVDATDPVGLFFQSSPAPAA